MNSIRVNKEWYKLPEDEKMLASVLNHYDMVKKGVKSFIKLYDMEGEVTKFSTSHINASEIEIKLD
jgi:hypothetical protein